MAKTIDRLLNEVIPAVADYEAAEMELSEAYAADSTPSSWETAAREARRRAAQLAIAIQGLVDRAAIELGISEIAVRYQVSQLCRFPTPGGAERPEAIERLRAVAAAYRHHNLTDKSLPILSEDDVLAVASGYGVDGYSVGKNGPPEVMLRLKDKNFSKFLGDAPVAIAAWFDFLEAHGALLPAGPYRCGGFQVHP